MGNARNVTADLVDWSENGLSVSMVAPIKPATMILVRGKLGDERVEISRRATILWCKEDPKGGFRMGLEFVDAQSGSNGNSDHYSNQQSDFKPHNVTSEFQDLDYYEIMQLSPNADTETVHRVYRLLAQRYHPDNTDTGHAEHADPVGHVLHDRCHGRHLDDLDQGPLEQPLPDRPLPRRGCQRRRGRT